MTQLLFSTGNTQKYGIGKTVCSEYDIVLTQKDLDIDEVQSESLEYVARRKAEAAFALLKQPVIISDDAWEISALNGFPGTYAKSVNQWFSTDDWIRLTQDLEDREILLLQSLVYQDEHIQQYFVRSTRGVLLHRAGGTTGATIQKVVSLELDQKTSMSEAIGTDTHHRGEDVQKVWHDFAQWYTKNKLGGPRG